MIAKVKRSNTIAFPVPKNKGGRRQFKQTEQHITLRLELSNVLQSTLELAQILQLFLDQVKRNLSVDSLRYQNEESSHAVNLGEPAKHSCHYKLITNEDSLGEISFTRDKRFAEHDLQMLELLIGSLICPIRSALLYQDAIASALRDPLTGTGNRMAMENTLTREVAIALRHKQPLSMLVVDIDAFKKINDIYGHAAGDCVLKNVARTLTQCSRDTDSTYRAYRFGGEEFVLLLNNTNRDGAVILAERIREGIEEMITTCEKKSIHITASIGVSTLRTGESASQLFDRADKALYTAKDDGRNQVISADPVTESRSLG